MHHQDGEQRTVVQQGNRVPGLLERMSQREAIAEGIQQFKRAGGRFVSINPVRTGYSAIADEWVPIRPGTDGALLLACIHELIRSGQIRSVRIGRQIRIPRDALLEFLRK